MSRNEYPIFANTLWWAGGVLRGGVVNGDGLVDAMGSMVFFFVAVSDADRGVVAGQVGVERASDGFGSRSRLVATRRASSMGFGRSVMEVAFLKQWPSCWVLTLSPTVLLLGCLRGWWLF